jgi:hypothetical protein
MDQINEFYSSGCTIDFPEYPYHVDEHEEGYYNWVQMKTMKHKINYPLSYFLPTDEEIHQWWLECLQMSGF